MERWSTLKWAIALLKMDGYSENFAKLLDVFNSLDSLDDRVGWLALSGALRQHPNLTADLAREGVYVQWCTHGHRSLSDYGSVTWAEFRRISKAPTKLCELFHSVADTAGVASLQHVADALAERQWLILDLEKAELDVRWCGLRQLDTSCDGRLPWEEFKIACEAPAKLRELFHSLESDSEGFVCRAVLARELRSHRCLRAGLERVGWTVSWYGTEMFGASCGGRLSWKDVELYSESIRKLFDVFHRINTGVDGLVSSSKMAHALSQDFSLITALTDMGFYVQWCFTDCLDEEEDVGLSWQEFKDACEVLTILRDGYQRLDKGEDGFFQFSKLSTSISNNGRFITASTRAGLSLQWLHMSLVNASLSWDEFIYICKAPRKLQALFRSLASIDSCVRRSEFACALFEHDCFNSALEKAGIHVQWLLDTGDGLLSWDQFQIVSQSLIRLHDLFKSLDANVDGHILRYDLATALLQHGSLTAALEKAGIHVLWCSNVKDLLGENGGGHLSWEAFRDVSESLVRLRKLYLILDTDCDGLVWKVELACAVRRHGTNLLRALEKAGWNAKWCCLGTLAADGDEQVAWENVIDLCCAKMCVRDLDSAVVEIPSASFVDSLLPGCQSSC